MQGRVQQWSAGAQRIFGYAPEEILGRDLTLLMPEPHRSQHSDYVASFLRTRTAKVIGIGRELTAVRKDGTEFPIELAVSEVRDGTEVFFTGILRDITERERAKAGACAGTRRGRGGQRREVAIPGNDEP